MIYLCLQIIFGPLHLGISLCLLPLCNIAFDTKFPGKLGFKLSHLDVKSVDRFNVTANVPIDIDDIASDHLGLDLCSAFGI